METYPIVFDGKRVGTLELEREGLMTVFSAAMPERGELTRLSVYGEGREGYLGIMAPDGRGNIVLRRRMSRAALASYPWDIDHAGPPGELEGIAPPEPSREPPETRTEEPPKAPVNEEPADPSKDASEGRATTDPPEDAPKVNTAAADDGLLWFTAPDGSLAAFDGRRTLVALPSRDVRVPPGAESVVRYINGREYVVFPW